MKLTALTLAIAIAATGANAETFSHCYVRNMGTLLGQGLTESQINIGETLMTDDISEFRTLLTKFKDLGLTFNQLETLMVAQKIDSDVITTLRRCQFNR